MGLFGNKKNKIDLENIISVVLLTFYKKLGGQKKLEKSKKTFIA